MRRIFGGALTRARGRAKVSAHLDTSPWGFAIWWVGLLLLHGANLAYYSGVAVLYKSFDKSFLDFQLSTYSIGIARKDHVGVSKIHAAVASLHAFFMALMIASSLYAHKLVFHPDMAAVYRAMATNPTMGRLLSRIFGSAKRQSMKKTSARATDEPHTSSSASTSRRVGNSISRTGSLLFARDGLLGVDSVYFDHVMLVRELFETGLQSYQAYRMSQVLPRLWLIRFYVALLVANCWAVPFLHRYYKDKETKRRMLCLVCDAVLDMLSSIGVSFVIFCTYAPQYNDPNGFGFPFITWFDDEWFSNMQQEFQMMLVASWGDMVSRLVFAFGLLQCMDAIKEMLTPVEALTPAGPKKVVVDTSAIVQPQAEKTAGIRVSIVGPSAAEVAAPDLASVPGENTTGAKSENAPKEETVQGAVASPSPAKARHGSGIISRVVHFVVHVMGPRVFVLWGWAIVVVHLVAESTYTDRPCALLLKPWLSSKPGCSLVEINCALLASSGHDDVMEAAWDEFDPNRAARIVIRHCPELQVSAKIEQYHKITGLKLYNSTVIEWGDAAALTAAKHANLRAVFLIRTNFPNGELPAGLLSTNFPHGMTNFLTCVTNLQVLPTDLDKIWPLHMQLALEFAQFTAIPDVVVRLQPWLMSMAGSPVSVIQPELIEVPGFNGLQFGLTMLQELPRNVTYVDPYLAAVFVQNTNVTTFWSWLDTFARFTIHYHVRLFNAYGTPYCRELLEIAAGSRTTFSVTPAVDHGILMDVSTPEKLAFAQQAVDCTDPGQLSYFPLPAEDAKHALRR